MLAVAIGALLVSAVVWYYLASVKRKKLPPGPPGILFIGNAFQLDEEAPHKTITDWHEEYGDVYTIKMFGNYFVILGSYETIYQGLVTKSNDFAGRSNMFRMKVLTDFAEDIAFTTFNKKWIFMKKLTMTTLKMYGNNLENLETITLALIEDMTKDFKMAAKEEGAFDPEAVLHSCTAGIISSILYGKKLGRENVKDLLDTTKQNASLISQNGPQVALDIWPWLRYGPLRNLYKKLLASRDRTKKWFYMEMEETKKRFEPGNPKCLLDGLFEYQNKEEVEFTLTDHDIYGISLNMIFAGTVTTSTSLYALVALWIDQPWLQQKMYEEVNSKIGNRTPKLKDRLTLTYIEAAICELFRYTSIVPLNIPHCTTTDTSIGGYELPKGTRVFYNLWKLHHDPSFWDEPWEFKPERFLDEQGKVVLPDHPNRKRVFAFGAGRRICVGETLAKNRLFLMVVSLLQRFEFTAEAADKLPIHDPRKYKNGFGINPPPYKCHVVPRC